MAYTLTGAQLYLYWGMGPGIYGARLDRQEPTRLETEPKLLIEFNPANRYERMGQHHQNWENGFPEGSWMLKYQGTYYLIWATAGTQFDSYCMGAYKSVEGPLSGFVCQSRPVTDNGSGFVRGGGHGSVVEGPNGTLWCFYTVNIGLEGDMERRIACDAAAIDENGDLYVPYYHEEPQFVPGEVEKPQLCNITGEDNLTARQNYLASSHEKGHPPVYAIDENMMTYWEPSHNDKQPSLLVSLWGNYEVSSARVIFKESGLDIENGRNKSIFQYKVEVMDTKDGVWRMLIDRRDNTEDYIMDYQRADQSITGQYVRLTITGWNHDIDPAVIDFTCFGRSIKKP